MSMVHLILVEYIYICITEFLFYIFLFSSHFFLIIFLYCLKSMSTCISVHLLYEHEAYKQITLKMSHPVAAVHAREGKFCSQSLLWEMCPCLLLPATTKRLHVSGRQHIHLMSPVKVQQIYLVNGKGRGTERGTNSDLTVKTELLPPTV